VLARRQHQLEAIVVGYVTVTDLHEGRASAIVDARI